MKRIAIVFLIIAALAAGVWIGRQSGAPSAAPGSAAARKVLFYQSPMHPHIKSDQPGNCTICGMKLVPVYEGDKPLDASGEGAIRLSEHTGAALNIATAEVTRQPLRRTLRVSGIIDDDDTKHRRLSATVDARIDRLMVDYVGAHVTAGEPLAHLYSPVLLTAREDFLNFTAQPASPQRERLLEAARGRLLRMGLTPEQIEALPRQKSGGQHIEVLAPISGTVIERNVYEGQYVKEGDVLFEIGDFSQMWFVFDVYERDLSWVRVGQMVEITTPSAPGKTFTGPVSFIDPNLDPRTRSAKVRVVLQNPSSGDEGRHELLHKVFAEATVQVEMPETLVVPRSAVLAPGREPRVYVAKGEGEYEARRVQLGQPGEETWEVLAGLAEGEKVVTAGNLFIDAQAQLEMSDEMEAAPAAPAAPAGPARRLTSAELETAQQLFAVASELSAALAGDDLAAFNRGVPRLAEVAPRIRTHFSHAFDIKPAVDLAAARASFHPLSMALAEQAKLWRTAHPELADVHIFECPMVDSAIPDAPPKGRWVQLTSELRNPFFGAEMLSCGAEVQP